jgi:hypothetical protein
MSRFRRHFLGVYETVPWHTTKHLHTVDTPPQILTGYPRNASLYESYRYVNSLGVVKQGNRRASVTSEIIRGADYSSTEFSEIRLDSLDA